MSGKLFAFEGIDGSGKTTQVRMLRDWLRGHGQTVTVTHWASAPQWGKAIKRAKNAQSLTPLTYSLSHALDFAVRYQQIILPALAAGDIVLADRYVFTAYSRDQARGLSLDWVKRVYSFAQMPDETFYFTLDINTAIKRVAGRGADLKYYAAGLDMQFDNNPIENLRKFQTRIAAEYDYLCNEFKFVIVDSSRSKTKQHSEIKTVIKQHLQSIDEMSKQELLVEDIGAA